MDARIAFLLAESKPHPNLALVQRAAGQFVRVWQALWAAHGDGGGGAADYRAALRGFMATVQQHATGITLKNELTLVGALVSQIGKVALTLPELAPGPTATAAPAVAVAMPARPAAAPPRGPEPAADPVFERPLFLVSAPRSGSTLLFETLAQAPGLYTIGGESHALIEGIAELSPVSNGLGSNRLTAAQAAPQVAARLRERFQAALRDRAGRPPAPGQRLRMLEKTPKNALRVPFLASVFPEARFLFLYRELSEVLGSMLDAWSSGRFRTYPGLPGWPGPDWSLLLVPGWQQLAGRPLPEVVAGQWEATLRVLLDDLAALPPGRVIATRYDRFLADPQAEARRLCEAAGIAWDRQLDGPLPPARYTLSPPAPGKWRRHAALLEPLLPRLAPLAARAEALVAGTDSTRPAVAVA